MSEVHFLGFGPSGKQHKVFQKWVQSKKYPFKGARSGYCRPFLSEIKLYSVKLKDPCMPMFLSELKASTQEISRRGSHIFGVVNWLTKWAIKTTNFAMKRKNQHDRIEYIDMSKVEKGKDTLEGWFYTKIICKTNDVKIRGQEEL